MATQITDENLGQYLSQLGKHLENPDDTQIIEDVSEVGDDTILPGVKVENGTMTGYIRFKLAVLKAYLDGVKTSIQTQWNAWFGIDDTTEGGVQKTWKTWFTGRSAEWDVLKSDAQSVTAAADTATQNAQTATTRANTAATGAENVNAQLSGLTVSITDRNGTTRTVDMSFDFYNSYASVAAMNADAANIPLGKLVSIATNNKTDPENARIYQKRSDGQMVYIADLDQASAAAWADWLDNEKPVIEQAISDANTAAGSANDAASAATEAAGQIDEKLSELTGDLYPRFEVNTTNMTLVVHHVDQAGRFTIDTNGYLHVNA